MSLIQITNPIENKMSLWIANIHKEIDDIGIRTPLNTLYLIDDDGREVSQSRIDLTRLFNKDLSPSGFETLPTDTIEKIHLDTYLLLSNKLKENKLIYNKQKSILIDIKGNEHKHNSSPFEAF